MILTAYGGVFRRAADGLFAWTVLQPLRGDDGQREVVSQSGPLLPVLTGGNVPPSSRLFMHGNAHVQQLPWVCVCVSACVRVHANGGAAGLFSEGGNPAALTPFFGESVSAAAPRGLRFEVNQYVS